MKARHDGQLLHRQLLGRLLVTMAATALDLCAAPEVFWSGEPGQQRGRFGTRGLVLLLPLSGRVGTVLEYVTLMMILG